MQAFKELNGKIIPLAMKNVDTDMIIAAQYLTQINRDGYGAYLFKRLKENDAQFVFNQPQYDDATILLSQTNFGCGSSREHAVWALQQAGIKVIIAESFSDIFFNNAAKNGLLLITLASEKINFLLQAAAKNHLTATVALEKQTIIIANQIYSFEYDAFRKTCLLNGYDDMDYLLNAIEKIAAYEKQHRVFLGEKKIGEQPT